MRVERGKTTRERLITAGFELFGRHGYEATSVSTLLETTGLARGAFYHHFATKAELFDAVLDRVIGEIAEASADAARKFDDPVESLRAGCTTWLDHTVDPVIQRIVMLEATAVVGWDRCRQLDELHTLGRTKATLRRIARTGRLPEENVDMLAHMVLAAVGEAAMLIARAADKQAARRTGQAALDTLLNRLVTPSPAEGPAPSPPREPRTPA
ncbi:MAG TPA: TetR/AcrR family transcriptional regulator [Actinophytocola sp.]|uniref:TetR/AcrR family transcriptional regulator n=1 Tax=Actinophytocola sp. TaxID=1872138 RepID=UPI002DB80500|nr:TetR/AcrR family transcriptional regulator [Actinophytocola sp.]HEU5472770.1 TetR/AcrR family transcriptional regulator [Actinophytocola sp.]